MHITYRLLTYAAEYRSPILTHKTFSMYKYLSQLSPIIRQNPSRADSIADSFSVTQLKSKRWLVDELLKLKIATDSKILILGGWYGTLLVPMLNDKKISNIILTDVDPITVDIARQIHSCQTHTIDAENPSQQFNVDVVINTSCEHMMTIGDRAVSNSSCLYVLQSCDSTNDPGHINTSTSTDDFVQKTKLSTVLFKGRMNLGHKNRFMVIGYK